MAEIATSTVALRFFGDALDPDHLTTLLGKPPTKFWRKGDVRVGKSTGREYRQKTGAWLLTTADHSPENLGAQLTALFADLTSDLAIWRDLSATYDASAFCGLFMGSSNDILKLSTDDLHRLSSRGLNLMFDIYDPSRETEDDQP